MTSPRLLTVRRVLLPSRRKRHQDRASPGRVLCRVVEQHPHDAPVVVRAHARADVGGEVGGDRAALSNATGSNSRQQPETSALRSVCTTPSAFLSAATASSSARANVSRSSTSSLMCVASSRVLWTHRRAEGETPCSRSRICAFARMTASGVLSSWEASETKRRCCSHACSTGRSAQPESRYETMNSAPHGEGEDREVVQRLGAQGGVARVGVHERDAPAVGRRGAAPGDGVGRARPLVGPGRHDLPRDVIEELRGDVERRAADREQGAVGRELDDDGEHDLGALLAGGVADLRRDDVAVDGAVEDALGDRMQRRGGAGQRHALDADQHEPHEQHRDGNELPAKPREHGRPYEGKASRR